MRGNTKNSRVFIIISFLLLFSIMGLRDVDTGGSDSSGANGSYPVIYSRTGQTDWGDLAAEDEDFNEGFKYFMKCVYELTGGDYQAFITIISMFAMFAYMRFVKKYSPSPIQSVLCFLGLMYFTFLFDALKQAMAMSVLLFAFDAIIDRKPVKFVLLVLIAMQFHFPALVFLPAYWIGRMKVSKSYFALLAVMLLVTYIFREQILRFMLDAYGGEDIDGSLEGIKFLRNKAIIMLVIVAAAVILRPPTEGDTVYNACLMFAGVAIVFQTFCGFNNIFERLADYYFHTSIVFIPLIFEKCELKKHLLDIKTENMAKSVMPVLICGFAIWRFLSFVNNSPLFLSYKFLWQ